jgi:hypothetical protein
MAHSPLPWETLERIADGKADQLWIVPEGPPQPLVCIINLVDAIKQEIPEARDNAKLIVRAVNYHAKLFQALADLCEWEARNGGFESPCWDEARKVLNAIRDERDGTQPEPIVFQQAKPENDEFVNTAEHPARVLITVEGGCADYCSAGHVEVLLIDYDNEPDAEIPEEFQGLS